ncbi:MAG: phosphoenolpyruvate carboxykinase (GTP) [Clostridiales bacterium]|jgi:phosphoenolpyruvate carboxykinase (GTP)|nr:phosphoenolpyruvate carboxykinase (GTP) [Clostridiales bacterium]
MPLTNNKQVLKFIDDAAKLVAPDRTVWIDGGREQLDALAAEAVRSGELIKLNGELLPGCYLHRTALNDVARVEHRTFICCRDEKDAGPTNNWMDPKAAYAKVGEIFKNSYNGRTMYVVPFSMGPVGSPFSKAGIEITDSIYVVLNMHIMTRIGKKVLDALGDSNDFVRGLHARAELSEEKRYICHFPEDNTIWSVNSGYGGNVLLGKKCFALRIASYQGKSEGWMAEHMLILGVQRPDGDVKYIAAAFPSACGKTNLAMLVPPKEYADKGYKVWCVGDDIAWIRPGKDGRLYAINPENGFFGVAPGTNAKSNPNALASVRKNTIFTNVAQNLDDNTVWWEKLDNSPPKNAIDWTGAKWDASSGKPGAHPNSRFTAPAANCPCISPEFENPQGVPLSAVVFGGRRASTAPLVYEARSFRHGVFVGAVMASETTAAAAGQVGVVRRDPMAMLPFCGYHMGDYFRHWLNIGKGLKNPPKIFNVNWFRTDAAGNFMWPGYGENLRVLEWILRRCEGGTTAAEEGKGVGKPCPAETGAVDTAIGYLPEDGAIDAAGAGVGAAQMKELLNVDAAVWREEAKGIGEFFNRFGNRLPKELKEELEELKARLG